ncbi:hypothetical protein BCR37DRAFT_414006 [Protomyces lactucae-debilis]|uniref:Uncharacterized protein n=1 Tax=Protomyces lactucae-debilis TaxID=2754530 RepID=A0A1Y2FCB6_PROLT|nr:uncharacterized protein BCR37DRAFT_414006 [Protomyces lactucae-debilis]ORY81570.1 hypothetical protein BCR37DRAFT_414006 [Protomyces lactucae-debilis]
MPGSGFPFIVKGAYWRINEARCDIVSASPQYVRAWSKYVEQDPAYRDAWTPEKLYLTVIHWRLHDEPTVPKLSTHDAEYVYSLPQLLEMHLKLRGLKRLSRARLINEFCTTKPTFDEASLSIGHVTSALEAQVQRAVGIIHPEHEMQLDDEFTLWMDGAKCALDCSL